MKYFVEVVGSMDAVHVGPFQDKHAAIVWAETHQRERPNFDYVAMSETEKAESEAEFGALPLQEP